MSDHTAVRLILLNLCFYHVRSHGCKANSVKCYVFIMSDHMAVRLILLDLYVFIMSDHMAVRLILLNLCFYHVRSHGCKANSVKFMFLSCQITRL